VAHYAESVESASNFEIQKAHDYCTEKMFVNGLPWLMCCFEKAKFDPLYQIYSDGAEKIDKFENAARVYFCGPSRQMWGDS